MARHNNWSKFGKVPNSMSKTYFKIMSENLISKNAALVGCYQSVLDSIYKKKVKQLHG